jgi:hypothetical protein
VDQATLLPPPVESEPPEDEDDGLEAGAALDELAESELLDEPVEESDLLVSLPDDASEELDDVDFPLRLSVL